MKIFLNKIYATKRYRYFVIFDYIKMVLSFSVELWLLLLKWAIWSLGLLFSDCNEMVILHHLTYVYIFNCHKWLLKKYSLSRLAIAVFYNFYNQINFDEIYVSLHWFYIRYSCFRNANTFVRKKIANKKI